jgi:hypothetical protein
MRNLLKKMRLKSRIRSMQSRNLTNGLIREREKLNRENRITQRMKRSIMKMLTDREKELTHGRE